MFVFLALATCRFAVSAEVEAAGTNVAQAIRMGVPFSDNAVFQQKIPLPVWGTSLPGASVTVTFDTQVKNTIADTNGAWRVVLDPMVAVKLNSVNDVPKGLKMTIACEKEGRKAVKEIKNILIGEVWLCSGQSNMAGKMRSVVKDANYPALRQLVSPPDGPWLVCTPENASEFKRVCFYFARRVQRDIVVPVGVINAAVGGSKIETWLNQKPFERGENYDRAIAPLIGFGLRGAIWYQGESNEKDGRNYLPKLRSLIVGWRDSWKQQASNEADGPQSDFSFYFVQLPGIGSSSTDKPAGGDGRAEIRQAYVEALAITNTGMSVGIDIGALGEHPPNKYDTGIRLAHWVLNRDYGFKDLVPSGPLYRNQRVEGNTIRISFDYAGNGLMVAVKKGLEPPEPAPDAKLSWLSIQGKDGVWRWADGKIDGQELIVSCKDVQQPVAVRYAYTQHPCGNLLYNKDGLPASPFTTCGY